MVSGKSSSMSLSMKNCCISYRDKSKCASMTHLSLSILMDLLSARLPSSKPMAPRMMLLPAPVSPVMTEKPGYILMFNSSMSVKFLIYSCLSMIISIITLIRNASFGERFPWKEAFLLLDLIPCVVLGWIDGEEEFVNGLFLLLCAFSLVDVG